MHIILAAALLACGSLLVAGPASSEGSAGENNLQSNIIIHPANTVGETDDALFSSFLEHMGRAVYHGIYEPGHPKADGDGFRRDVIDLLKPLGLELVRYPGGNFLSGYDWKDGIGPKQDRPRRLDLAWKSVETNQVGVDEFMKWCAKTGVKPMMGVNLGTAGAKEAIELMEYCNHPGGTYYSDLRKANGHPEPYGVKYWCLGNEMDGDWQICHKTAEEYGRLAYETGKLMKLMDPECRLTVCGSSAYRMSGDWETEVLKRTWPIADYIAIHGYYGVPDGDIPAFLASNLELEEYIKKVAGIIESVRHSKRSDRRVYISVDEWNVAYHGDRIPHEDCTEAPHIGEDHYVFVDSLAFASLFMTILRNCDNVKAACFAQLVNVLAPVLTENTEEGGRSWAQTIYWPFLHLSKWGRGTVLDMRIAGDTYDAGGRTGIGYLDSLAVLSRDKKELILFAVNRSLERDMDVKCDLSAFGGGRVAEHTVLNNDDLNAENTPEEPDRVKPRPGNGCRIEDGCLTGALEKHSWNVIRIRLDKGESK
ncbi:MAG: alpha-N-arabinofuranosidase [Abditibacteriota bacterium]|nr:alpha-N-arabinofuranosidase [Abditibacteriota bacterium]